jgi:hypothetical protein
MCRVLGSILNTTETQKRNAESGFGSELRNSSVFVSLLHLLAAESYKETQMVKIKEEPMEVDIQDSQVSISPSRNVGYSTLMGREKTEPLQKMPEGRVSSERNLFSQDISVKMASELLFQLSGMFSHRKGSVIGSL